MTRLLSEWFRRFFVFKVEINVSFDKTIRVFFTNTRNEQRHATLLAELAQSGS